VRGIFEQFPTLKLVVTHLGGGICEVIGRMNYAYTLQEEAFFLGSYEPMLIKHPPLHYLKMCYLDSVCYHLPAARCVVETVGADKMVFGTDAPPLTPIKGDGIQMIRDLKLAPADEAKVFSGNAKKLLKIA
jgi:aminocarboxymuconate-semialdehyde decarboxylase